MLVVPLTVAFQYLWLVVVTAWSGVGKGNWRSDPCALHSSRLTSDGCYRWDPWRAAFPNSKVIAHFLDTSSNLLPHIALGKVNDSHATRLSFAHGSSCSPLMFLYLEQHLCPHHVIIQFLLQYSNQLSSTSKSPARMPHDLVLKAPYYRCSSCLPYSQVIYVLAFSFLLDKKLLEFNNLVWIIFESITVICTKDLDWIKCML